MNDLRAQAYAAFSTILLVRAAKGDTDAARQVCKIASECLASGGQLPDDLRRFLALALKEISEGKSAGKALLTERGPGRADIETYDRDAIVLDLMEKHIRRTG